MEKSIKVGTRLKDNDPRQEGKRTGEVTKLLGKDAAEVRWSTGKVTPIRLDRIGKKSTGYSVID